MSLLPLPRAERVPHFLLDTGGKNILSHLSHRAAWRCYAVTSARWGGRCSAAVQAAYAGKMPALRAAATVHLFIGNYTWGFRIRKQH